MLHQNQTQIRVLSPADISPEIVAAWSALESWAVEPNAYLSPHFILPAVKFLDADAAVHIVLIEQRHAGSRILIGLGVFASRNASTLFPLPHIEAYRSTHSFLSGLLVDSRHVDTALNGFFDFFCAADAGWQGVVFRAWRVDGALHPAIVRVAAARKLRWVTFDGVHRAVLVPNDAGEPYLKRELSSQNKSARRSMRKLEKIGQVTWRICDGTNGDFDASIGRFLELENMGWRGVGGSSLLACHGHGDFFREMAGAFLQNRQAFFAELCLDGKIISSTFNLTSGNAGFAFKIGWDPAYAQMSVGTLNEIELIRYAPEMSPSLDYIDSGSMPGSYMDKLWTARQRVVSGGFATRPIGRVLLPGVEQLRSAKQWLQRLIHAVVPAMWLSGDLICSHLNEVTVFLV